MPKFLEKKLKQEYPDNPGAVYGTMNTLGFMHGNKETPAGAAAQAKHELDEAAGKASPDALKVMKAKRLRGR